VPYSILLVDGQVGANCLCWLLLLLPAKYEKCTGSDMNYIYDTQKSETGIGTIIASA
jgi:hypothetical protein